jgi:N-acetyl-anhydromuramyl-L-alanine amidase AmpD
MINKIVIHCSESPNGREDTAEDIHRWHKEKGWDGIGYHYVIERKGKLVSGRPEYWQGAHASGHNKNSLGICLIGTDEFNVDQFSILDNLLRKLKIKYPGVKIIGHNEVSIKTCPGFNVQWWLNQKGI